jgi:hypothetical protein
MTDASHLHLAPRQAPLSLLVHGVASLLMRPVSARRRPSPPPHTHTATPCRSAAETTARWCLRGVMPHRCSWADVARPFLRLLRNVYPRAPQIRLLTQRGSERLMRNAIEEEFDAAEFLDGAKGAVREVMARYGEKVRGRLRVARSGVVPLRCVEQVPHGNRRRASERQRPALDPHAVAQGAASDNCFLIRCGITPVHMLARTWPHARMHMQAGSTVRMPNLPPTRRRARVCFGARRIGRPWRGWCRSACCSA